MRRDCDVREYGSNVADGEGMRADEDQSAPEGDMATTDAACSSPPVNSSPALAHFPGAGTPGPGTVPPLEYRGLRRATGDLDIEESAREPAKMTKPA